MSSNPSQFKTLFNFPIDSSVELLFSLEIEWNSFSDFSILRVCLNEIVNAFSNVQGFFTNLISIKQKIILAFYLS